MFASMRSARKPKTQHPCGSQGIFRFRSPTRNMFKVFLRSPLTRVSPWENAGFFMRRAPRRSSAIRRFGPHGPETRNLMVPKCPSPLRRVMFGGGAQSRGHMRRDSRSTNGRGHQGHQLETPKPSAPRSGAAAGETPALASAQGKVRPNRYPCNNGGLNQGATAWHNRNNPRCVLPPIEAQKNLHN